MIALALIATLAAPTPARPATSPYWPGRDWERRTPAQAGLDAARLQDAIAFAKANETSESRDLERAHYTGAFGREPFNAANGPLRPRGDLTGIVVRHGYIVAEWGEPDRVDVTNSVTKSFLSSVVGVAVDRSLIRSVDDPVAPVFAAPILDRDGHLLDLFSSPHAKTITWDHLLR